MGTSGNPPITSAPRHGGDVLNPPDPRRWWALALLCGAFFMVLLDGTIVLVALPSIQADLGFSEQGLQWVLSAYELTFGGLLLLGGRAADLLGRRRLFMTAQQVLGYLAIKFGVGSVVLAVGVAVGAIVAQTVVLKAGFRPVAATGMALMGTGSLLLTQVSVGGSYLGDIFIGLLVGPGIGLAFVTATVAALGVAIATTVAVSRSVAYLAANEGASPLVGLTEGFQSAFLALVMLAGIGMALALLLLGRPRRAPQERLEAVPVPAHNDEGADRRRVMVRFTVRADQATTNEQVRGCAHAGTERSQ
jgi:MFS family permease